jgi:hypothetical protein
MATYDPRPLSILSLFCGVSVAPDPMHHFSPRELVAVFWGDPYAPDPMLHRVWRNWRELGRISPNW